MTDLDTLTRATYKDHGQPTEFYYWGRGEQADEQDGTQVVVSTQGSKFVLRRTVDNQVVDTFGFRTKFWASLAAPEPEPTVDLVYVLVNGDFAVHAPGCKDVKRDLAKSDYSAPGRMSVTDYRAAVADLWYDQIRDDHADESELTEAEWSAYEMACDFHSCVELPGLPDAPAKTVRPAGKPCTCGCSEVTNRNRLYRQGHDAKHVAQLFRAVAAGKLEIADAMSVLPTEVLREKLAAQIARHIK